MIDYNEIATAVEAGQVKALSIRQPWPHSIFVEGKDVENRDWSTKYRGWFAVHAGVNLDGDASKEDFSLPRGGIVGMARITDCVSEMESRWFFGKYGFVLADAFPLDLIPCKGRLSFFYPDVEALEALATALRAKAV